MGLGAAWGLPGVCVCGGGVGVHVLVRLSLSPVSCRAEAWGGAWARPDLAPDSERLWDVLVLCTRNQ